MNTKNNQRSQKTQSRIKELFIDLLRKKNISKITVREICEQLKINRSTFYAHFVDTNDLLEAIEEDMSAQLVAQMVDNTETIGEGFENIFAYIKENADFYQAYFSHARTVGMLNIILPALYKEKLSLLLNIMGYATQAEYEYHSCFFISGITGLIRRWLDTGCMESPQDMSAIIYKQYNPQSQLFDWSKKTE